MRTVVLTRGRRLGRWPKPFNRLSKIGVAVRFRTSSGRTWEAVGTKGAGYTLVPYVFEPLLLSADRAYTLSEQRRMKKKKKGDQAGDQRHLAAVESNVFAKLPGIVAHCAVTRYDDGDPRKAGWITVKTQGSAWVVEAKDPDTCGRLQVVQASLDDALALMSVMLESEEAPWEHDVWLAQQKAKESRKTK